MSGSTLKTYSHLAPARRMPTEYELVTSKLHYYVGRGFEVDVPIGDWFRKYQLESPLLGTDWDQFVDPRATTYTKYVAVQADKERYLETLHHSMDEGGYDAKLDPEWLSTLERFWSPVRFLGHGLQMLAAYVGQMAPSGRVTIACALQAADEMRRVQWIAYRTAQLRKVRPAFGANARDLWQRDEAWQPIRRLIEQLLVTFDWAEAFAALNLCTKPLVDEFFLAELAEEAGRRGDPTFGSIAYSLKEDARWHREWSTALVELATKTHPGNAAVLRRWSDLWLPRAEEATSALARGLGNPELAKGPIARQRAWLREVGVSS